jgi:phosphohistidine swiveling domain-containing protein
VQRLIPLDSRDADDSEIVGAKAARLSRAMSEGLPVLGGWVLPVAASSLPLRLGGGALQEHGRAAATRVVSSTTLDAALSRDLDSVEHPTARTSVVRSSTTFDDDGRWAGAFATYHDVEPALLPVAVRGCWASAFSSDVTARARACGQQVMKIGVGVLIQPWLTFAFGGTARWRPDDGVELTVAGGGPAGIVGGAGGTTIEVDPRNPEEKSPVVAAAAALSRATAAATGDDRIEWGWVDDRILLLQAGTRRTSPMAATHRLSSFPVDPRLRSLARTVTRFRAPLGDRLVVPWALATDEPPEADRVRVADPESALVETSAIAARMAADAWDLPSEAALRAASDLTHLLLGPEPDRGIAKMPPLRPVDRDSAAKLLGLVAGIGRTLVSAGALDHEEDVWRLSLGELQDVLARRGSAPARVGPDRWEPFAFQVAMGSGRPLTGTAASPGMGVGRAHRGGMASPISPPSRSVIVAHAPFPQLAPLLFRASAVVAATGSMGAHLFEVARSLGIPAVVGVDLSAAAEGTVVAVDGDQAEVALLEGSQTPVASVAGGA